jgi:hypothetical protein
LNSRNRSGSVVETLSHFLDTQLHLDLSLHLQFCRFHGLKPKPPRRPPRPRRRPQIRRSLVPSGVRNGERDVLNGVRNDARDAQSGVRSGAQDATSDGTLATAPPPPSKKSNRSLRGTNGNRPASVRAAGRPYSAALISAAFHSPTPTSRPLAQFANKNNQLQPEPAKRERTIPRWQGLGSRIHG